MANKSDHQMFTLKEMVLTAITVFLPVLVSWIHGIETDLSDFKTSMATNYVTKSEIEKLETKLDKITDDVNDIKTDIKSIVKGGKR